MYHYYKLNNQLEILLKMYFQGNDFQIISSPNIFERKTFLSNGGPLKPVF